MIHSQHSESDESTLKSLKQQLKSNTERFRPSYYSSSRQYMNKNKLHSPIDERNNSKYIDDYGSNFYDSREDYIDDPGSFFNIFLILRNSIFEFQTTEIW